MEVYFDNAATTRVAPEVAELMRKIMEEDYGNPSSRHVMGMRAENYVRHAAEQVAATLKVKPSEILFTSGGTESDNLALIGTALRRQKRGRHIISLGIEHAAIYKTLEFLEEQGFRVTFLPVDEKGHPDLGALEAAICPDTILVSIMYVNNEVGSIQPVREIGEIADRHGVLFHIDAVQAAGNVPIDVRDINVDMLSLSSHKIYGPKGVGALFIRAGLILPTYIHGGAQESRKRAGTENIPAIVGFGKAAEIAKRDFDSHVAHVSGLRDHFVKRVLEEIPHTYYNGSRDRRHPGNANITFEYIEGEAILLYLDFAGISASSGSACSSKSLQPSHVLEAMGVPVELIHGSIRFTFGDFTTMEDTDYAVDQLKKITERLREISSISEEKGW